MKAVTVNNSIYPRPTTGEELFASSTASDSKGRGSLQELLS